MKNHVFIGVLMLLLVSCMGPSSAPQPKAVAPMGLLKVTVSGIGEGVAPTAQAQWITGASSKTDVSGQALTVVPVNGSAALGDVQLIRRYVGFLDDDPAGKRNIIATFDLVNRTNTTFNNFTLYAVNMPTNLGGTGIAALTSGTGAAITDPAVARSFKPTHGMRTQVRGLEINPSSADLQWITADEASEVKNQAVQLGILGGTATVLEYGFVARNYTGGRTIAPANSGSDCTADACKGTFTLAYQIPKLSPRQNNPFSFSLFFVVANETVQSGSQSLEEQAPNTVMGQTNPSASFAQLRTLAGSSLSMRDDRLNPICQVKAAIGPDIFLTNPIPTASGSLDGCFGAGGKRTTEVAFGDQALDMAIQADGKIVVVGTSGAFPNTELAVVRYNPNGSLDTSFDADGKVTTSIGPNFDAGISVALQEGGKIVVVGHSFNGTNSRFALVRYNPSGSLDTSFGAGGKVTTAFSSGDDIAYSVAIQSDGKIVVAGAGNTNVNPSFALARYNSNGSLDTSFDTDGKVFGPIAGTINAVAIQADGKIVVAGVSGISPDTDITLARYNTDGSLDTSFDGNGTLTTAIGTGDDTANALAIQSDGKIVVVGSSKGLTYDFALVRYNPDGSLDSSFDTDGKVITEVGTSGDIAYDLALQEGGKIVVVGQSTISGNNTDFALLRYNPNGSLDTGFGPGGKVITAVGTLGEQARAVAIQPNGKIVVAGYITFDTFDDFAVVRYNP